ncbi:hypothetical protein U1Q18_052554 [Sarracenia purpurea var. burkii]
MDKIPLTRPVNQGLDLNTSPDLGRNDLGPVGQLDQRRPKKATPQVPRLGVGPTIRPPCRHLAYGQSTPTSLPLWASRPPADP